MIGRRQILTARPLVKSGLVAWWPLSAASGTSAVELSGGGRTGTLTNFSVPACWVPGPFGNALDFDGTNDHVLFSSISLGTVHTCCAWINPDAQTAQYNFGALIGDGASSTNPLAVIGSPSTVVGYTTGTDGVGWTFPGTIAGWHHIATTRNGVAVSIYFDGVEKTSGNLSVNAAASPNRLGARDVGLNYNGRAQDVRMYDRVLTASEILSIARGRG